MPTDSTFYDNNWTVLQKLKYIENWLKVQNLDPSTINFGISQTGNTVTISITGTNFEGEEVSLGDVSFDTVNITFTEPVVNTLPEGSKATVEIDYSTDGSTVTLTFGIPQGATGAQGEKGDTGDAGTDGTDGCSAITGNSILLDSEPTTGNLVSLPYDNNWSTDPTKNDVIIVIGYTESNNTYKYYLLTGIVSKVSDDSLQCVIKSAPEIAYSEGAVTNNYSYNVNSATASASTLAAGSSATASVTASDGALNFTFGIPKGDKGDTGATGANGTDGTDGQDGLCIFDVATDITTSGTTATLDEFTVPTDWNVKVGDLCLGTDGIIGQVESISNDTYTIRFVLQLDTVTDKLYFGTYVSSSTSILNNETAANISWNETIPSNCTNCVVLQYMNTTAVRYIYIIYGYISSGIFYSSTSYLVAYIPVIVANDGGSYSEDLETLTINGTGYNIPSGDGGSNNNLYLHYIYFDNDGEGFGQMWIISSSSSELSIDELDNYSIDHTSNLPAAVYIWGTYSENCGFFDGIVYNGSIFTVSVRSGTTRTTYQFDVREDTIIKLV